MFINENKLAKKLQSNFMPLKKDKRLQREEPQRKNGRNKPTSIINGRRNSFNGNTKGKNKWRIGTTEGSLDWEELMICISACNLWKWTDYSCKVGEKWNHKLDIHKQAKTKLKVLSILRESTTIGKGTY